jgi:hypothetical protein
MTGGRIGSARDRTVVVAAPTADVFTRVADIGARTTWSGRVGRIQLLREVDPDLRTWSVERRLLARPLPIVYHVAAMSPGCVEVRVSIDGCGVVTRYELSERGDATVVHLTTTRFCRGGRPTRRAAFRLHRLARLLERDDDLVLAVPRTPAEQPGDVSPASGSRHNRRG